MRKERILYIIVGILFITYVVVEYYSPKPLNWTVTYSHKDKNPYGSFVLYDRLDDLFSGKEVSFNTLYESIEDDESHLLILSDRFIPSRSDIDALFQQLRDGKSIFISSQFFSQDFLDTLGISVVFNPLAAVTKDSVQIDFNNEITNFPAKFINAHFDSLANSKEWEIKAAAEDPILIQKGFGTGKLILSSTPLVFTNYGFMELEAVDFIASALSLIPNEPISYSRFYQSGKLEPATPLRYLLSQEALRWALYLTILLLFVYLVVASRRIQRMIPIREPNTNITVQFIKTIGGLYHKEGKHHNAGKKLISHFLKTLTAQYYIPVFNAVAYHKISAKSGVPVEKVIKTFDLIEEVKRSDKLSEAGLKQLYDRISMFKLHQR